LFRHLLYFIFCFVINYSFSQTAVFKEDGKWGIKENGNILIKPAYDTIFNFDSTFKVCLACAKIKSANPNKYIKTPSITFNCRYLNKRSEPLIIKQFASDTCSIFSLGKNTVAQYLNGNNYMTVAVKNHKHLVYKDFTQITSKGYDEIHFSSDPEFLVAENKDDGNVLLSGLINKKEEQIIPMVFSHVKVNSRDSLIIACTTGQGANSEDDVFNYKGEKIAAYKKHIELATKDFIVHKIFSPKEYLIVYNIKTKEEKVEYAQEVYLYKGEELLMMNEGHWFLYDMNTHKKSPYDLKHQKK